MGFDGDRDFVGWEEGFWLLGCPASAGGAGFDPLPRVGVVGVVVVAGVVVVLVVAGVVGVVFVLVLGAAGLVVVVRVVGVFVVPVVDGVAAVLVVAGVVGVVFVLVLAAAGLVVVVRVVGVLVVPVVDGLVFVPVAVVVEPQFSLSLTMAPLTGNVICDNGVPGDTFTVNDCCVRSFSLTVTTHSWAEAVGIAAMPVKASVQAMIAAPTTIFRLLNTVVFWLTSALATWNIRGGHGVHSHVLDHRDRRHRRPGRPPRLTHVILCPRAVTTL